jgi:hypothetical protein
MVLPSRKRNLVQDQVQARPLSGARLLKHAKFRRDDHEITAVTVNKNC